MLLGLINGGPFRPFNRAISARCSTTVRSSSATLPNSPTTSSRSWADDRTSRSNGGLTQSLNLTSPRRGKEKVHDRPGFCPCYIKPGELIDIVELSPLTLQDRRIYNLLIQWEFPRLCRGSNRSLTFPGVVSGHPSMKLRFVSRQSTRTM